MLLLKSLMRPNDVVLLLLTSMPLLTISLLHKDVLLLQLLPPILLLTIPPLLVDVLLQMLSLIMPSSAKGVLLLAAAPADGAAGSTAAVE